MRVLVTGASGFVGRALVPALAAAGHEVLAATRRPTAYTGAGRPVALDVLDGTGLAEALDRCDVAYYLVHSMEAQGFAARDREAAARFAGAASAAGARVVYLGGLGQGEVSEHLRSRHEVGRILRDGADTVELRAAIVLGRGGASFEIMRQLVDRLPAMVCPKWVTTRCQPIALPDMGALPRRRARHPGWLVRRGRPRHPDLRADDAPLRHHHRPAPAHHQGARPDSEAVVAVARPGHRPSHLGGPAPCRRPVGRGHRRRRPDPITGPVRPARLRRRRPACGFGRP